MAKRNRIPFLGALAAGMLPYRVTQDKETGAFAVGSLLWSLKKAPGAEQDTYTFELLPLLGGKYFTFFLWSFDRPARKKQ